VLDGEGLQVVQPADVFVRRGERVIGRREAVIGLRGEVWD
jgi:hypothetical protein